MYKMGIMISLQNACCEADEKKITESHLPIMVPKNYTY